MELDPRIILLTDIITCFDEDQNRARQCIGKMGYFSDDMMEFNDLNSCVYGELTDYGIYDHYPFRCSTDNIDHAFFIPESVLKPKPKKKVEYRPYTLNEFLDKYRVCTNIRIRQKDKKCQYFGKLTGYSFPTDPSTGEQRQDDNVIVCIGGYNFKLIELFRDYEQYVDMEEDKWVPCGVEVEE